MIEKTRAAEQLWATPVLSIQHQGVDELNRGLARIIHQKELEIVNRGKPTPVAGQKKGLGTHWLEYNVLNWDFPEIVQFRQLVLDGLREYFQLIGDPDDSGLQIAGISCWANIVRFADALEVHHHDPGFVSAHYQVQTGYDDDTRPGPEKRGALADSGHTVYYRPGFLDRSHGGEQAGGTSPWDHDWRRSVQPVEGKLFIFPSYVRHEVRPYLGNRERISIAMDIYVKKQPALIYFGGPRWFVPK